MDKCPGVILESLRNDIDDLRLEKIVKQMLDFLKEMKRLSRSNLSSSSKLLGCFNSTMSIGSLVHDGPTLEPSLTYLAYLNKHFQWNIKEIQKLSNYSHIATRLEHTRLELLDVCEQNKKVLNDLDFNDERTLIHGDLNSSNVLVDPTNGNVTAILDWEFASFGFDDADFDFLTWFDDDVIKEKIAKN